MNLGLRSRHRWLSTVLAVIVPFVFIAGIALRPGPMPSTELLPRGPAPMDHFTVPLGAAETLRVAGAELSAQLFSHEALPQQLGLELEARAGVGFRSPDLLVYWSPSPVSGASLPDGAHLLGALAGVQPRRFELPAQAARGGWLLFYSHAHQRLLESPFPLRLSTGAGE